MGKLSKKNQKRVCRSFQNNNEYFEAILSRDFKYDNIFVYGDKTAGYYCRPSCGKYLEKNEDDRRKNKNNYTWFKDSNEAEEYNYTPCGRCHEKCSPEYRHVLCKLEALKYYREKNKNPSWEFLISQIQSKNISCSRYHICREFNRLENMVFRKWLTSATSKSKLSYYKSLGVKIYILRFKDLYPQLQL